VRMSSRRVEHRGSQRISPKAKLDLSVA